MRKAVILLGVMAVIFAAVEAKGKGASEPTPTFMDSLLIKAFEYIRVLFKGKSFTIPKDVHERITDPQFNCVLILHGWDVAWRYPETDLADFLKAQKVFSRDRNVDQYHVDLKLGSITFTKAEDFVINKLHNDVPKLTADFDLTLPNPTISGVYEINGSAAGRKVSGSGKFSISLQNFNQKGFIKMSVKNKSLFMETLNLDFSLTASKWNFNNLKVEGITEQQALDFMNKNLIPTVNAQKAVICARFAEQIKLRANRLLAGKSLFQIIEWLNKFIKGGA